jgi:hypothetical protein
MRRRLNSLIGTVPSEGLSVREKLEKTVMRELASASPYVMPEARLVEQLEVKGFRKNSIRKAIRQLDKQGLITRWKGSRYGYVVLLSDLGARQRGLKLHVPENFALLSEDQWMSLSPEERLLRDFQGHFWRKQSGGRKADNALQNEVEDEESLERVVLDREMENCERENDCFGIQTIGVTRTVGWSPAMEPEIAEQDCQVCRTRRKRGFIRAEVCLGCFASGDHHSERRMPLQNRRPLQPRLSTTDAITVQQLKDRISALKTKTRRSFQVRGSIVLDHEWLNEDQGLSGQCRVWDAPDHEPDFDHILEHAFSNAVRQMYFARLRQWFDDRRPNKDGIAAQLTDTKCADALHEKHELLKQIALMRTQPVPALPWSAPRS